MLRSSGDQAIRGVVEVWVGLADDPAGDVVAEVFGASDDGDVGRQLDKLGLGAGRDGQRGEFRWWGRIEEWSERGDRERKGREE
jgi:hypothetical protein